MEKEPEQPLKLTIGVLFTLSRLLLLPVVVAEEDCLGLDLHG